MKKRIKILLVILIPIVLIIGGVLMKNTSLGHFLIYEHVIVTKQDQIDYLKKHEQEMTEHVKKENPKLISIQWDWESIEVVEVQPNAGGIPTGKKHYELVIEGKFNGIVDSILKSGFYLDSRNSYPKMSDIFYLNSDDVRYLHTIDGVEVWDYYK